MKDNCKKLILNLARVDELPFSGFNSFSCKILKCLSRQRDNLIILTHNESNYKNFESRYLPKWYKLAGKAPKLRPILWTLYSRLFFPYKNHPVLTPTHHGIPSSKNQIISIHDLIYYFCPYSFYQYFYFHFILPRMARKAKAVITVSHSVKRQLKEVYGLDDGKIHVIPNAVDLSEFSPPADQSSSHSPYLLMVGASLPHKNVEELLHFQEVWRSDYHLMVVLASGKYRNKIEALIKETGLSDNVTLISRVERKNLISLYQNASALIFPSKIEGFGIPPLEAMACATPVIASNLEVFREIYDTIPIYVDLGNRQSWQKAFAALKDKELIEWKRKLGLMKAKEFSEDKMCHALLEVISTTWQIDC